jgi:acyl-CoA thioesterase-1
MIFKALVMSSLILALSSKAAIAEEKVILFLGDSLTSGYGIPQEFSYPRQIEKRFKSEGVSVRVVNGAEAGSLSSALLARIQFYQKRLKPQLTFICSGGNDARQKRSVAAIKKSLGEVLEFAQANQIKVALCGMQIFSNLGPEYGRGFKTLYEDLAKTFNVPLYPFLLEGVAAVPDLNQKDGFHPNEKGHKKIADALYPFIKNQLKEH